MKTNKILTLLIGILIFISCEKQVTEADLKTSLLVENKSLDIPDYAFIFDGSFSWVCPFTNQTERDKVLMRVSNKGADKIYFEIERFNPDGSFKQLEDTIIFDRYVYFDNKLLILSDAYYKAGYLHVLGPKENGYECILILDFLEDFYYKGVFYNEMTEDNFNFDTMFELPNDYLKNRYKEKLNLLIININ